MTTLFILLWVILSFPMKALAYFYRILGLRPGAVPSIPSSNSLPGSFCLKMKTTEIVIYVESNDLVSHDITGV